MSISLCRWDCCHPDPRHRWESLQIALTFDKVVEVKRFLKREAVTWRPDLWYWIFFFFFAREFWDSLRFSNHPYFISEVLLPLLVPPGTVFCCSLAAVWGCLAKAFEEFLDKMPRWFAQGVLPQAFIWWFGGGEDWEGPVVLPGHFVWA